MGDGGDTAQLVPRLCHIVRWSDFNGYGFNLHAEKGKAGQFIGKVDDGSPAEAAGLKQGDRIVEVNGTNIGNENHQQVVARIKAGGEETRLLVVDPETDQYYKDEKKVVRGDLPEVLQLTAVREGQVENEDSFGYQEAEFAHMEAPDAEPAATIGSVSYTTTTTYNNDDTTNGDADESSRYPPRLCRLCKWPDFDGYGFNLHAEKDKPGQYIGSVDADSPAETGGLKEGDRIIEVNGENIESQTHSTVIGKIKAGGERTTLLVVDREADQYYKGRGQTVSSHMASVVIFTTPTRESETVTATVSETVETAPEPEPDNLQNGSEEAEQTFPPPVTDDVAEAVAAVAVDDDDDVVDAAEEELSGGGVDVNAYEEVTVTQTTYDTDFGTASNGINGGSVSSVPEPTPVAAPEPEPSREPEPAVIRSTTTTTSASPAGGDELLQLSAAEMKERLKSRKRQDPRLQKTSFEAKHKMFERM